MDSLFEYLIILKKMIIMKSTDGERDKSNENF